jgi:hypothetical protein
MTTAMREKDIQDALHECLVSEDWTDEHMLRERAEARLGHKLKYRDLSRAVVALLNAGRIERRRARSNGDGAMPHMQYRRVKS